MGGLVTGVEIRDVEGSTVLVEVTTFAGKVQILAEWERIDRRLLLKQAHIQGLSRGALGRGGLNAIADKLKEIADVDTLEVHGAVRTTGRNRGRPPKLIVT